MGLNNESSPAIVYLILYTIVFVLLILGYVTRRLKLRSRYSALTFHVTLRLVAQAIGLTLGIKGFSNSSLLVAYFVFGAEGYFTLVLAAFRFLISWENHNSATHESWLEREGVPAFKRPMLRMYWLLVTGNVLIIAGGSLLAGRDAQAFSKNLPTSKGLRVTGQVIFLLINTFLLYCVLRTIRQSRRENPGRRIHPTLLFILAAWPLLFVRGMYGVLAGLLPTFNYFDPSNYTATGFTNSFVTSEYILSTTMEWTSCVLLLTTWYTSRNDPKKADLNMVEFESGKGAAVPTNDSNLQA